MLKKTTLINIKGGKGPRRELREGYGANKKLEKALDLLGQAQNRIRELLNGVEIELPNTIHEADISLCLHIYEQEQGNSLCGKEKV